MTSRISPLHRTAALLTGALALASALTAPATLAAESGLTIAASPDSATTLAVSESIANPKTNSNSVSTSTSTTNQAAGTRTSPKMTGAVLARASIVNGIVVTGSQGRPVSLTASGAAPRTKIATGNRPVAFTGLTPGRRYTAWVAGRAPITVTAVSKVADASGLIVRATDTPTAVRLSWRHQRTIATGGTSIGYRVTATPLQSKGGSRAPISVSVSGTNSTVLRGLNPEAAYVFTVTPRNSASTGRPTTARMTSSLASLLGSGSLSATNTSSGTQTSSAPALISSTTPGSAAPAVSAQAPSASAPASQAAPVPTTRTIWVCPDGFTDAGTDCITMQPYTFTTRAYTYTTTQVGMHEEWIVLNGVAWSTHMVPTYADIKDATPAGFTDDGTAWIKRDHTPVGYLDDGTQWVKHETKISRIVPA